jgi:DNA-binding transcriptional ArsR family regulator
MGKITEGDRAREVCGQQLSTTQVQRMNELRQRSKDAALSSTEENELIELERQNRTRTRVL